MPWPDEKLSQYAKQIPVLLRRLEENAAANGYGKSGLRFRRLAELTPGHPKWASLQRNWSRWKNGTNVSDGAALTDTMHGAERCGWMDPLPNSTGPLVRYLRSNRQRWRETRICDAERKIKEVAVDVLMSEQLRDEELLTALPSLVRELVEVAASAAQTSVRLGDSYLVRLASQACCHAVSDVLNELAMELEAEEMEAGIAPRLPEDTNHEPRDHEEESEILARYWDEQDAIESRLRGRPFGLRLSRPKLKRVE